MKKSLLSLACAAAIMISNVAHASLITFEGHPDDGSGTQVQDGFTFTFSASGWGIFTDGFSGGGAPYTHNGTTRLMLAGGSPGQVTMFQTSGDPFSLQSLDAASMFPGFVGTIDVTGSIFGGGTVSTSISIDDTFDSYSFLGFSDLVSINFAEGTSGSFRTTAGFALDNLTVNEPTSVPEPDSLALFGVAALGLVLARRRDKA